MLWVNPECWPDVNKSGSTHPMSRGSSPWNLQQRRAFPKTIIGSAEREREASRDCRAWGDHATPCAVLNTAASFIGLLPTRKLNIQRLHLLPALFVRPEKLRKSWAERYSLEELKSLGRWVRKVQEGGPWTISHKSFEFQAAALEASKLCRRSIFGLEDALSRLLTDWSVLCSGSTSVKNRGVSAPLRPLGQGRLSPGQRLWLLPPAALPQREPRQDESPGGAGHVRGPVAGRDPASSPQAD